MLYYPPLRFADSAYVRRKTSLTRRCIPVLIAFHAQPWHIPEHTADYAPTPTCHARTAMATGPQ